MASDTHLILVGAASGEERWAEARLRDLELRWSRFLAHSEISRLNRSAGGSFRVHPDTVVLIETMQHASRLTSGRYDPTMLCEIVDAGYSRSIEDPRRLSVTIDLPSIGRSVHDIKVDRTDMLVHIPAGMGLDPGGIGKGLAGDIVVSELLARGAAGALACIGGDLAFAGAPPSGADWEIAIANPFDDDAEVLRIGVTSGGVATSSRQSRRWRHHGRIEHHILDPRTRSRSVTDLASVTVVGSAGWQAEALASAAILEHSATVETALGAFHASGLAVTVEGTIIKVGALRNLVADRAIR